MRRLVPVLSTLTVLLVDLGPSGAAQRPPEIAWRTIETEHFFIHFNAQNESLARRLAAIVEPIHTRLSRDLQWVPQDKTHVNLVDYLDVPNGSAIPTPFNTIEIFVTPPTPGSQLGDYDDWLRLVFTHEYVHILHLDQASGISKISRDVLGRGAVNFVGLVPVPFLPFPNLFLPSWMIEGYATLGETRFTTAGRGDSTYARMVLRMAALEGRFFPLDKGNGEEGEWPGGAFRYLYGEAFLHYLAEKYGVNKLNELQHTNALGLTPFLPEIPTLLTLGSTLQGEWDEWHRQVRKEARHQLRALRREGLTEPIPLTEDRWQTGKPRFSPDGNTVYFVVADNQSYPRVEALDLRTRRQRVLFDLNLGFGNVAPSPDGGSLYFTAIDLHEKFAALGDAYRYDLHSGKVTRLTLGERLLTLDVSPDGAYLVAVRNAFPGQSLVLYRIEADRLVESRVLVTGAWRAFDAPRFSPDGTRIAYAGWTTDGCWDVYLRTLDGHEQRLGHDRYLDFAPVFSPDSSRLFFVSDRTGIFNVFSVSVSGATLTASPIRRETNVIGGLLDLDIVGSTIVSTAYGADGFYIADVALRPRASEETEWVPDRPPYADPFGDPFSGPTHPYDPLPSLWPKLWSPLLNFTLQPGGRAAEGTFAVGMQTAGRDALGFHAYELTAFYERAAHRPGFSFAYTYDRLTPTLNIALQDQPVVGALRSTRQAADNERPYHRAQAAAVAATYPFLRLRWAQTLSGAYVMQRDREFGDLLHSGSPQERRTAAVLAHWTYDSAKEYAITFGQQDGMLASLTSRWVDRILGATYTNLAGLGDMRYYWRLPWRQALALQTQVGVASPTPFTGPFVLGGTSPRAGTGDIGILPLRGFTEGEQQGTRLAKTSLEYRFPLGLIKRGIPFWATFPFLVDQLHGAVFAEAGSAWRQKPNLLAATGLEFYVDFTVGYLFPISLGIGYARPIRPVDQPGMVYLTAGPASF